MNPMDNKQVENGLKVATKSFMTAGPTLHYSHKNVRISWLLAILVFGTGCLFWSKILTGSLLSFELQSLTSFSHWHLGHYTITGVSIFEYLWQIFAMGLLMGIIAIVPLLISQLMSFRYSIPFILSVVFLANLPGFAISLLISCIAAACRPLRFRSRFTAIALCTVPQLFYWGLFGGAIEVEPLKWGLSFTPWICAWLTSLTIAGVVLGIGHFTRYRPGLVWTSSFVVLLASVVTFKSGIGFDELDYQLYVAKNNPEQISLFHDHSITEILDAQIKNPTARLKRHIKSRFYPTETIALRAKLKEKIQSDLQRYDDRWPSWFIVPDKLNYPAHKRKLLRQYELFISRRSKSPRMPIALYYKALLIEYSPDIEALGQKELLRFYSDYPYERAYDTWYWLYTEFGQSPESLEARWRVAMNLAGQGKFGEADKLILKARIMVENEKEKLLEKEQTKKETLFSLFRPPAKSVITVYKLTELQRKLSHLRTLISTENRTEDSASVQRLAKFITLNPHSSNYSQQLNELLVQMGTNDPLRDNVLLAQTKLVADNQLRAEKLGRLHKKFKDTDGGMQALYELGLLKISQWRQQDEPNIEQKKKCLAETRETLTSFINLYPESIYTDQVKKNLDDIPTAN